MTNWYELLGIVVFWWSIGGLIFGVIFGMTCDTIGGYPPHGIGWVLRLASGPLIWLILAWSLESP